MPLSQACRSIGWDAVAPAGSFFAWLPVPVGFTSEEFADYLLESDVALQQEWVR